ncbi:hypothetical protein Clacol_000126 [Clathrus columnatus]|uniref:Uncharacterized protein n=1 Tax=Clathrus columnatus TaxID=1419009 RepID=A0AAV4ZWA4_9AGAM|nr:hypothetical protein Clacol_000126 [Clathrus columnatus]
MISKQLSKLGSLPVSIPAMLAAASSSNTKTNALKRPIVIEDDNEGTAPKRAKTITNEPSFEQGPTRLMFRMQKNTSSSLVSEKKALVREKQLRTSTTLDPATSMLAKTMSQQTELSRSILACQEKMVYLLGLISVDQRYVSDSLREQNKDDRLGPIKDGGLL